MGLLIAILAGAFIGWIASMIMKTNASMGAVANIIAGLLGALVGSFISSLIFKRPIAANFDLYNLVFGIIGACIVIAIWKAISGTRTTV